MSDSLSTSGPNSKFIPKPNAPPPPNTTGVVGWLRHNLFNGWFSSLTTVMATILLGYIALAFYDWAFVRAVWEAENLQGCRLAEGGIGTCWAGIIHWFPRFIYGRYPDAEVWRIDVMAIIFVVWMAPLWIPRVTSKIVIGLSAVTFFPFFAGGVFLGGDHSIFMNIMMSGSAAWFIGVVIHTMLCSLGLGGIGNCFSALSKKISRQEFPDRYVYGFFGLLLWACVFWFVKDLNLEEVRTNRWGGLFLTLVVSGIGISSALPSGVILALGRRSNMLVIRILCTGFIEVFRSVPLITILFMAITMFPMFLPEGLHFNKLVSAIVAVCLFASAYMAEVVRGGLQALPRGQYEAAESMGLKYWQVMSLVIMPQALKIMIPNIVGNFIGLFKDTTLVSIVGLYDLLLMVEAVSHDPQWIGLHTEPLFIAAVIFFVGCFAMSRYSQHLERKLGAGAAL
jgi:general L-amino acid transport system permease protein